MLNLNKFFNYDPHEVRFKKTIRFIKESEHPPSSILDIGGPNRLSNLMQQGGFDVTNTNFDLDKKPQSLQKYSSDAITAFEVLEHLVNPLDVLQNVTADRLFASVPLNIWFSKTHYNENDPWDRHFHEFEDWQFDWLLDHAGWKVIRKEKWTSPSFILGIRPVLRLFVPYYYIVEAVKK
ncbi:MAG TPA: methyltransferase domain-containing protein [Balneolaceae bacterium]